MRAQIDWISFQSISAFCSTGLPFILVKRQFEEIACLLLVFAVKILQGFQICIQPSTWGCHKILAQNRNQTHII